MAIVLGDMDLLRPLGLAGIACAVVARRSSAVRHSRFTARIIEWTADEHELVERMCRFARSLAEPPVLYFEHDQHVLMIANHRSQLESCMRFALPGGDLAYQLIDKIQFLGLAQRHRLPVPRTTVLDPVPGTITDPVGRFPAVIKPATRADRGWLQVSANGKAVGVRDEDGLRELIPALQRYGRPVLVQEEVPGHEDRIESYHAYLDPAGAVAAEFTGRKIRTFPAQYGHSTALTTTDAADVRSLGRAILRAIGFRGVAKVDFKRSRTGDLVLLEINPRFSLWHHVGAIAGVNLPKFVWCDLVGEPRPVATPARAGVTWSNRMDLRAARANRVPLLEWLSWTLRCDARSGLAADDILPAVMHLAARLGPVDTGKLDSAH